MSELVFEINSKEEFDKIIKEEKVPVLVDLWATWCTPCKMQAPILHAFAEDMKGKVKIVKVDVDVNEEIASQLQVRSIPTIMLFVGGELKEKQVGLTPKAELSEMVIKYL